jgi:hypothetical protein
MQAFFCCGKPDDFEDNDDLENFSEYRGLGVGGTLTEAYQNYLKSEGHEDFENLLFFKGELLKVEAEVKEVKEPVVVPVRAKAKRTIAKISPKKVEHA